MAGSCGGGKGRAARAPGWGRAALLAAGLWATFGRDSAAQSSAPSLPIPPAHAERGPETTVHGTVLDGLRATPIVAAAVDLLDAASKVQGRAVTDRRGHFVVTAMAPVTRIRVLHIGHHPHEGPIPAPDADGTIDIKIALDPVAVSLDEFRVIGTPLGRVARCPARPDSAEAAERWAEARAVMGEAFASHRAPSASIRMINYARVVDQHTGRVVEQTTVVHEGPEADPGYVVRTPLAFDDVWRIHGKLVYPGNGVFYGPDVDLLLDGSFTSEHCFSLADRDAAHDGETGIAFVPGAGALRFPDLIGVLWLDDATRTIMTLEYHYANDFSRTSFAGSQGGTVQYRVLPSGVPVVERWIVRVGPIHRPPYGGSTGQLFEAGAELVEADLPGSSQWVSRLGSIAGRVRGDGEEEGGTRRRTPSGVEVSLEGTSYAATTDSAGAFLFRDVIPGKYLLRTRNGAETEVNVVRDSTSHADLVVHAPGSIPSQPPEQHVCARIECDRIR